MIASRSFHLVAGIAAAATLVLTGCSGDPATTESEQAAPTAQMSTSGLSSTDPSACAHFRSQSVSADAPVVPIVVDRTGSVRELELPPELEPIFAQIQSTGAVIQTIGVNGSGVPPTVGVPIALDPASGKSSRNADQYRQAALGCVEDWLNTTDTEPVGDNTDLLAAVAAATRQDPAQIVVISDGINTTSQLNLTASLSDPVAVADDVRRSGLWTARAEVPVNWFNMAETTPPMSEPDRRAVTEFWSELVGAELHLHTRTGSAAGK